MRSISYKKMNKFDKQTGFVHYSLYSLIVFMLICTLLAIIFVTLVADLKSISSTTSAIISLEHRRQGIITILIFIAINYSIGFIGLWQGNRWLLILFALVDILMTGICVINIHHEERASEHMSSWAALITFATTSLLSIIWILKIHKHNQVSASIYNANIHCYRPVLNDALDDEDRDDNIQNHFINTIKNNNNNNNNNNENMTNIFNNGKQYLIPCFVNDPTKNQPQQAQAICAVVDRTVEREFLAGNRSVL